MREIVSMQIAICTCFKPLILKTLAKLVQHLLYLTNSEKHFTGCFNTFYLRCKVEIKLFWKRNDMYENPDH